MTDKQPPTEWDRISLFLVLGAEFQQAHQALKFPGLGGAMESSTTQPAYWLQMMQTMLSRKFFARGSAVALPRVANALRECAVGGYEANVEQVAFGIEEQFKSRHLNLIDVASFDDVVNGRLLHADWDRFLRTQRLTDQETHLTAFLGSGPVQSGVDAAMYNVNVCLQNGWVEKAP